MKRDCRRIVATVVLVFWTGAAVAYLNPPTLSPTAATVDQPIILSISGGVCDGIYDDIPPQITQTGNALRVLVESYHSNDPTFCIILPGGTTTYSLGTYPVGAYTAQIDRHYTQIFAPDVTVNIGNLTFTVTAAASDLGAAPALDVWALVLLALLISAFARRRLR